MNRQLVAKQDIPHFAIKEGDIGGEIFNCKTSPVDETSWLDITSCIDHSEIYVNSLAIFYSNIADSEIYDTKLIDSRINWSTCDRSIIIGSYIEDAEVNNSTVIDSCIKASQQLSISYDIDNSYLKNCELNDIYYDLSNVHLENVKLYDTPREALDETKETHKLNDFKYIAPIDKEVYIYVGKQLPTLDVHEEIIYQEDRNSYIISLISNY